MPQRRADEDEIERAEREDPPGTAERQREATEAEIQEAEGNGEAGERDLTVQRDASEEEIKRAEHDGS